MLVYQKKILCITKQTQVNYRTITVQGCQRLCPGRYPGVAVNHTGCANPSFTHLIHITGEVNPDDALLLTALWSRVSLNITFGLVCFQRVSTESDQICFLSNMKSVRIIIFLLTTLSFFCFPWLIVFLT